MNNSNKSRLIYTTLVPIEILSILLSLSHRSIAKPLGLFVSSQLRDGYYFVVEKGQTESTYSLTIKDGYINYDGTYDNYGCPTIKSGVLLKDKCTIDKPPYSPVPNKVIKALSKNKYIVINSTQVMRITPNGSKTVLTWFKRLGQ